jgi:hypothetical protein
VDGYPNGTFDGEKELTRAEFVVIMSRVLKLDVAQPSETVLSDVAGHWSEKYVNAFTQAGYVDGFPDGTFQPDAPITRAQAVVLINRVTGAAKRSNAETPASASFADLPPDHWAYGDIMLAVKE